MTGTLALYTVHECLRLGFPEAYDALPPEQQPVVLASCYVVSPVRLHVYFASTERMLQFLPFFESQVPLTCAKALFIDEYNRISEARDATDYRRPEEYFRDESRMHVVDHDRIDLLSKLVIDELVRKPMEIYYADGIDSMKSAAQFREILVMEQHRTGKPVEPLECITRLLRDSNPHT